MLTESSSKRKQMKDDDEKKGKEKNDDHGGHIHDEDGSEGETADDAQTVQQYWKMIESIGKTDDPQIKEQYYQTYTGVAQLYHMYRPKYPDSLIDRAIELSPLLSSSTTGTQKRILEIGCGPGTLTLPLARDHANAVDHITAIDPGSDMIEQARRVCHEYLHMIDFQQVSFKHFQPTKRSKKGGGGGGEQEHRQEEFEQFDAIVAASSIHWALAESNDDELMKKLHSLLKDDGTLLLFWNFPLEPSDVKVLEKVADEVQTPSSTTKNKSFYFGTGSQEDHERRLCEKVLRPLDETNLFTHMSFLSTSTSTTTTTTTTEGTTTATMSIPPLEVVTQEEVTILHYISFLKTLSNYIRMDKKAQDAFFHKVEKILRQVCGETVSTIRKTIVNVARKEKMEV